jgi:Protein of unknown function (DUF1003)
MNRVLINNIQTLLAKREAEERQAGLQQRVADRITRFVGGVGFVYLHLSIFGAWIAINLKWTGLPPFDPSFVVLAMAASVEAIFLSTFRSHFAESLKRVIGASRRPRLQIRLLVEHEVTRILQVTRAVAECTGIEFSGRS